MEIIKIVEQEIDLNSHIQTVTIKNENEVVILTTEGEVILYNFKTKEKNIVFICKPKDNIKYPCEFDPTTWSSIYTLDDIIVVVNDYKLVGYVYNGVEDYIIRLGREDYYSKHSKYPIALFNYNDEPHLIFSAKWNRVDIVNLSTRQILTADKSLIEEDAEQRHIDFYKKYDESNKFFWPNNFDYFYGELFMSPDEKSFLSAGWVWGSQDSFILFDIEKFIENNRINPIHINSWEHTGRSVCFIDNERVAVPFKPCEDDWNFKGREEEGEIYEIRLYKTNGSEEWEIITLEKELDLSGAQICFNIEKEKFYIFSDKIGLVVMTLSGKIELQQKNVFINNYSDKYDSFIEYDKKKICILKLH